MYWSPCECPSHSPLKIKDRYYILYLIAALSKTSNESGDIDAYETSLLTEDLSDEPTLQPRRQSNWYLLSEEENTNTLCGALQPAECTMRSSYGSNLKQIFTSCAVPDLSTITEFSRETDLNSQKGGPQNMDCSTRSEFLKEFTDNEFSM